MRLACFLSLVMVLPACVQGTDPYAYGTLDGGKPKTDSAVVVDEDTGTTIGKDTGTTVGKDTGSAGCTPTSGKTCDTFPQCGCAAGENCNVATTAGATKCYPAGTKGTHERCSGTGQCDKGLQCVSDLCVPLCKTDSDCPMSGALCKTAQYTPTGGGSPADVPGFDICLAQCDPINPGAACGAGSTCYFPYTDDTTQCAAAGSSKSAGGCASDVFACAPGYICIDPGDCYKWCRVGVSTDCTGTGGTCTGFVTPQMRGGIEYGVCYSGA